MSAYDWLTYLAIIGVPILVLLIPAKYDPMIRWKEWLERKKK